MYKLGMFLIAVIGTVALYFLTPLSEYLEVDKITQVAKSVPDNWLSACIFLGVFLLGGALLIPIPLIAFSVSLVFNVWLSVAICILGFSLASISGYGVGWLLGADFFGPKIKKHLETIKRKMDEKGAWAVFALRLAPTPPFTITSIISGSLQIKLWKFMLGSTLGIAPLGLGAVFFGQGAIEMMKQPSGMAAASIAAAVILFILFFVIKKQQTE